MTGWERKKILAQDTPGKPLVLLTIENGGGKGSIINRVTYQFVFKDNIKNRAKNQLI